MPAPKDRTDRREYPGCVCEMHPPVPGEWMNPWNQCCKWAMGAYGSGHSGVLVSGKLMSSCTAAQLTEYGSGI